MSLLQQLRSIVIHGFRLAFFLPANRNDFDASYVASATVLLLIGSVWAGLLHLSAIHANGESTWLDALGELLRPSVFCVAVAATPSVPFATCHTCRSATGTRHGRAIARIH